MTLDSPPILDDSDWDVPAHEIALYAARQHRHALVIPVINEGERIRGQLLRIQAAGLPVDVVIADGGSTDGSLDADFVTKAGVRAVLTKTGPGKLSAQLRMAYAWCLRQGYAGIVTIDGNGKDGVEAVAAMVAKLEEGCDYVQGSRYLPGGAAENTPLERTIANRLIHAPLLSLSGRHWFTDTTNGFRAYSAAYLTRSDVRPFRDEFQVYNLLFYLTVRAGQLGLKVAHVPVVRRYPEDGKVPTKIGGFASKLALLKETVIAATGGYTPDDAVRGRASLLWPLAILLLVLAPLLLSMIVAPPYSPDSWALYELSQTVFGDFYRFNHWRSYASASPYSASFPPLYPTMLALADALLGTGPRTGLYLSFVCFAGFAIVSERIGRSVSGAPWLGLGAALIGLLGPNMLLAELGAGRTIPLQLLLFALILSGLLQGARISLAGAARIGFLAGLGVLNRFDAVLLPLLITAMILWLTRSPKRALAAVAAAGVAVAPWVTYSLMTFGTAFATDNSSTAASLDPAAYVTDWWPAPQPGLADDPAAWAARVAANVWGYSYTAAALLATGMGLTAAAFVALAALAALAAGRPRGNDGLKVLTVFTVITALLLAPQVLTGYLEHRYFAALIWAGLLAAGCWCIAKGATFHQRALAARLAFMSVAAAMAVLTIGQVKESLAAGRMDRAEWARFDAPGDLKALQTCVKDTPRPRILVLGDDLFAARAGALGGFATMMEPRNMAHGRLGIQASRAFVAEWQVDYVLPRNPARARWAASNLDVVEIKDCPLTLYRVSRGGNDG
ncbi:glycosyltransferase family 2 protein [Erythrobacter dokdonensis]|uniref:Glycosyl transferase n=1 Tax=Erythrobacter dokdonensis DSW-74 TaxID=1300349 RepID=A0A1A7BGK4_9SPHN|nr:glycosyltransferase family 2 protein [Erythrobacter dokdonensis]OBV10335.1 Glycosyl transferase [Erythrobacter dokdonensis DSW-74]